MSPTTVSVFQRFFFAIEIVERFLNFTIEYHNIFMVYSMT